MFCLQRVNNVDNMFTECLQKKKIECKMVVLYNENHDVIGDVEYNDNLDYWDGRNMTNGGSGRHLGFGQIESGEFYLIYGTQWQKEVDRAEIVSARKIVVEVIKSDKAPDEFVDYPELVEIYKNEFEKKIVEFSKVFSVRINLRETQDVVETKIAEMIKKIAAYRNLKYFFFLSVGS